MFGKRSGSKRLHFFIGVNDQTLANTIEIIVDPILNFRDSFIDLFAMHNHNHNHNNINTDNMTTNASH